MNQHIDVFEARVLWGPRTDPMALFRNLVWLVLAGDPSGRRMALWELPLLYPEHIM